MDSANVFVKVCVTAHLGADTMLVVLAWDKVRSRKHIWIVMWINMKPKGEGDAHSQTGRCLTTRCFLVVIMDQSEDLRRP